MNLVIGATGILGSHVVLKLLQNNEVVIACKQKTSDIKKVEKLFSYYTADPKQLFEKIKWVDVDVIDIYSIEAVLEGITTVYNCSGFVSFDKNDREKMFLINETGTANVVNACLYKKIDALCHVSSIATINNLDYTIPLNETVFWKSSGKESDYAISKYNGEREVWRGIEEGLNAVIVNPGVILSSGFWKQSSSKLFDVCYNGNKFYTEGLAGYIGAQDVASSMIYLINKGLFSNRYVLIEDNYSFKTILDLIQTHLKKQKPTINATKKMLEFARIIDAIFCTFSKNKRKITKPIINSAFNKQLFSNAKIKAIIPSPYASLNQVIEKVCADYLSDKSAK
ncbi:NAD-dependent epimerase/dehydratase family protein [Sediminibacterium sp.]|uniref:NAD-dependent epimerase/dehydratase family protein n=1 Tax=Sediminibacterium sp. TaxID=1917865 RepID=UPI00273441E3|nr:NAD-dependent epimerase/dehydratase family protein [Sediminibacterium sp.]MDP3567299.1 SDR family oxidoreductase [Sediminibacterium sp.]